MTKVHVRKGLVARLVAGTLAAVVVLTVLYLGARIPPTKEKIIEKIAAMDPDVRPKICAHQSNNIQMYRFAQRFFECVEIDIHVAPTAGGPASVYHPPDKNFHGLTLDSLLTQEKLPRGVLWLDTKDLSPSNWRGYLELLERLVPASRRRDVVIETPWASPDVKDAVAAFRNSGFRFSYYLPTDQAMRCGALKTPECISFQKNVLATLRFGFTNLSFAAGTFPFVKAIADQLPPETRLLTWDLSRNWPNDALLKMVDIYIINLPGFQLN